MLWLNLRSRGALDAPAQRDRARARSGTYTNICSSKLDNALFGRMKMDGSCQDKLRTDTQCAGTRRTHDVFLVRCGWRGKNGQGHNVRRDQKERMLDALLPFLRGV